MLVYWHNLMRPNIETIYALSDVYGRHYIQPLKPPYFAHSHSPSSFLLAFIKAVAFVLHTLVDYRRNASLQALQNNTPRKQQPDNANRQSGELGKKIVEALDLFCAGLLLDKMLVWNLSIYLLVQTFYLVLTIGVPAQIKQQ